MTESGIRIERHQWETRGGKQKGVNVIVCRKCRAPKWIDTLSAAGWFRTLTPDARGGCVGRR